MKYTLFVFLLITVLLTAGCTSENKNAVVTPTQNIPITENTPSIKFTIDEKLWQPDIDNTYNLTVTTGLNKITIPISPISAYRLNVSGEKSLSIMLYGEYKEYFNTQGRLSGASYSNATDVANNVLHYNGIIKTDSGQKNLLIRWVYFSNGSDIAGTTQNVNVKLERYNGDSTIFPHTTDNPSS